MTATLGDGDYTFKCYLSGQSVMSSRGGPGHQCGIDVIHRTQAGVDRGADSRERRLSKAAAALTALTANVKTLKEDLAMGDIPAAKIRSACRADELGTRRRLLLQLR